jgi:hypothetical protein
VQAGDSYLGCPTGKKEKTKQKNMVFAAVTCQVTVEIKTQTMHVEEVN